MRVPDSALYELSRERLAHARQNVGDAQSALTSGLRVQKASDDPLAAALARRHAARIAIADATTRAGDAVQTRLQVADDALSHGTALLTRASELAIELGNDTASASDRSAAATEIDAIRDELVTLANTQVEGRYVFAGRADAAPPFTAAGAFVGDATAPTAALAPGVSVPSGVSGATTFGAGSGTDVFATLSALSAAMRADDGTAIRASISGISSSSDQLLASRAFIGTGMDALEVARTAASNAKDESTRAYASLVEIDPFEAASKLAQAETALSTAVEVAKQLPLPGLASRG